MDISWIDWILLGGLVGVVARIEGFTAKRLKKDATKLHTATAEAVEQDVAEQTERLMVLLQGHISGPQHRR